MKMKLLKKGWFTSLLLLPAFMQQVQAQKETFFNHFSWNSANFMSAGNGASGYNLNSLYRNYHDSTTSYFSLGIPIDKWHSALGIYHLHNSSKLQQSLQTGISYTAFVKLGYNSSLHIGVLGNRHQQAVSARPWAFNEYQTDSVYYSADASIFLRRDKLELGLAVQHLRANPDYNLLLRFDELRTTNWLRSSPSMLLRIRHGHELPEWRYNYTATIGNFLVLGGSYYKNSVYVFGVNAGFKLFNTVWLTAATDFEDLQLPQQALYEFGLRMNIRKKDNYKDYTGY